MNLSSLVRSVTRREGALSAELTAVSAVSWPESVLSVGVNQRAVWALDEAEGSGECLGVNQRAFLGCGRQPESVLRVWEPIRERLGPE